MTAFLLETLTVFNPRGMRMRMLLLIFFTFASLC